MNLNINPLLLLDSYKLTHRVEYPIGTNLILSNWTPRGSRTEFKEVVFFGLQYFIKEYLQRRFQEDFFDLPKAKVVAKYKRRVNNYLGQKDFNVSHIEELHDLQYLPIRIKALPEGTKTPLRVPMLTIENTDPRFFWLTNSLETIMSNVLWMPCTSATTAYNYRLVFDKYADKTGADKSFCQWQGHDFSFRGMSGLEAAVLSGAGHLLSFTGSDTIPAVDFLEKYYDCNVEDELVAMSVAATEHSNMQANILYNVAERKLSFEEAEYETIKRLITEIHPSGIISLVLDTFDYYRVLTDILPRLKKEILNRNGKLVVRPDSSPKTPVEIIVGDNDSPTDSPEYKGSIQLLWDTFGGTITDKGLKVLDSHIGLIYGDSITFERQTQILEGLFQKKFASSNVVLGIGSFTYQYVTRDTHQFAVKATYGEVNGQPIIMYKDPKTDSGMKKSARGRVGVFNDANGNLILKDNLSREEVESESNLLNVVFEDGRLVVEQSLSEIRNRLH